MFNHLIYLVIIDLIVIIVLFLLLKKFQANSLTRLKVYSSELFGKVELWKMSNGEVRMIMNNCCQGISIEPSTIKSSYWHLIAQKTLERVKNTPNPNILHIGLGANTISRLIVADNPKISQSIIEIDPIIIQACRDYFNLNETPNTTIIQGDIFDLITKKMEWKNNFDVIITDIYTGRSSEYTLYDRKYDFILQVAHWLKPEGLLIFNRPTHTHEARTDAQELINFLKNNFSNVEKNSVDDPRGFENYVTTAIKKD